MPITPVFEQPPVARHARQIDWQPVLDALATRPGEWAKVDGPFPNNKTGGVTGRGKSLLSFAAAAEVDVEVRTARTGGDTWLYARLTVDQGEAEPPAPKTEAKTRPLAAAPDPAPTKPPSPDGDFGGDLECGECDAKFRTNTRLRQHQANAHKAS